MAAWLLVARRQAVMALLAGAGVEVPQATVDAAVDTAGSSAMHLIDG